MFGDPQAQAGARDSSGLIIVNAGEFGEEFGPVGGGDANAGVFDVSNDGLIFNEVVNRDFSGKSVFNGVAD